jgi:hypothetical protein
MGIKMAVDESNELKEYRDPAFKLKNPVLIIIAKVISYIFHPLFIPVYIIWFLIEKESYLFAGFSAIEKIFALLRFVIMYTFFPFITILLAKGLGFLESVYLKTQKDRIIPYIVCGIYYFWMSYVLRHQPEFASVIVQLTMAIFIVSSLGLIFNIYLKISMHAISMGIFVVFVGVLASALPSSFTFYISGALLLTGMVCTARLIASDHTPKEIYLGLLVGAVSQLIAVWADGVLP